MNTEEQQKEAQSIAQEIVNGVNAHYDGLKTRVNAKSERSELREFAEANARNFERAVRTEAEVARLQTLFRELKEHVNEPFIIYHDAETAVRFYADTFRQTVEYVQDTANEALQLSKPQ